MRRMGIVDYTERRLSRSAGWSRRLAAFSAVLFVVSGLSHRYGFLDTPGFIPVLGVVALLALAALLLAARAFYRLWHYSDRGGRDLSVGALIALAVLTPFMLMLYFGLTRPVLFDISTDVEDPPALRFASDARTPDMNPVGPYTDEQRRVQLDGYPLVTGRRYDVSEERVMAAISTIIEHRGWRIVRPWRVSQVDTSIEALAHTSILAFPQDVALRVINEGQSTYVDMRSASRYGGHDFGDNAGRIRSFLADLDVEISSLAGVAPAEPEAEPALIPLPGPRPSVGRVNAPSGRNEYPVD